MKGKRLGDIAIKEGLARDEEVRRCLNSQKALKDEGIRLKLGQVMVREDVLSTTELVRLLDIQKALRDLA